MVRLAIRSVAAVLVSGCAADLTTASCDPRGAGFLSAAAALAGGCYDQRLDERRQGLASTEALTRQLKEQNARLEAERLQTGEELRRSRAQLDRLTRDNQALRRKVAGLRTMTTEQARRKATLSGQVEQIEQQTAEARDNVADGQLDATKLSQEVDRLARERDALSDDIAAALAAQR